MVNTVNTIFLTLLATTAQVHARRDHRLHHHRRHNPHPTGTEGRHHHHHATGTGAPYGLGNSTYAGPTGTGGVPVSTETQVSYLMSTLTVLPVAETSEAAAAGSSAPAVDLSTSVIGNQQAETQCGPATVTVTAQNTVTVTVSPEISSSSSSSVAAVDVTTTVAPTTVEALTSASISTSEVVPAPVSTSEAAPTSLPAASPSSSSAAPVGVKPSAYPVQGSPVDTTPAESSPASVPAISSVQAKQEQPAASPSATAASTTEASTKTSTGSSGGKRGIVYTDVASANKFDGKTVSWGWNWNSDGTGLEGMEYVPSMQKPEWASSFKDACAKLPNSKYAKGINEVDNNNIMSPSDGASSHIQYMNPIASDLGLKVGSPSVTSCNSLNPNDKCPQNPSGLGWLAEFKTACGGKCTVDFIDLHWYGNPAENGTAQAGLFSDYVDEAVKTVTELFGSDMPIWFSEFSPEPEGDETMNVDFIPVALDKLEGNDRIQRYSYFMANYLTTATGLAASGQKYVDPNA